MRITEEEYQAIMAARAEKARVKEPPRLFVIPLKVISEANYHEHWRARHQRKKAQQLAVKIAFHQALQGKKIKRPRRVIMRRIGMRKLDSDNLAGAFKHCQDEIARLLRIDDGDDAITWHYEQRALHKRQFWIEVQFEY